MDTNDIPAAAAPPPRRCALRGLGRDLPRANFIHTLSSNLCTAPHFIFAGTRVCVSLHEQMEKGGDII